MGKWADEMFNAQPVVDEAAGRYSSELLGGARAVAPQADTQAAPNPMAELDADTWLRRRGQDIMGKQDPRFKGFPALSDALLEEGSTDVTRPMGLSALVNASDAQLGDIAKSALGERFIGVEKDANDYNVIRYRGKDGSEKAAYVNQPGLDVNDLGRAATGSLPFLATGGVIGGLAKGAGLGIQAISQAAGAGGTSIADDLAQMPLGSEQGVELPKAGITSAFGFAGPLVAKGVSALARRLVTIPSLFDKTAGKLTPKGEAVAKSAGVDPAQLSAEAQKTFAKTYAMTADTAEAATRSKVEPFGIPATKGQVSKDPFLLTQEEGMRRRLYGENAQDVMRAFDNEQALAVREAALGNKPNAIGGQIAPGRQAASAPQDTNPMTLGTSVREGATTAREAAKAAESAAWENVGPMTATQQALDTLPDAIQARLGADVIVDTELTPIAAKMAKEMDRFVSGEAPQQVAKVLKSSPVQEVGLMRKRLLSISRGAETQTDKRAATALYDAYNDWIDEAANRNLLSGDPNSAAAMKVARGFTREVREIFSPSQSGKSTPAAKRLAAVMESADSPEGVINQLLGSSGSRGVDSGTVNALANLKTGLDRFAPQDVAKGAWDDVRLAYWVRLVQGRNGEMLGPQAMTNNIKSALASQQSVVRTLYTPEEVKSIRQFVQALDTIAFKPPNASGSGYTAANFAKELGLKLFNAFGLQSKLAQTAIEYSGLPKAAGTAAARSAVNQGVVARPPSYGSAGGAAGSVYARDHNQNRSGR
jgi:hypothetical protein